MTGTGRPSLWLTLAMGVGFALIWSSAFSVAKILVANFPPFSISALRFFTAAVVAGAVALVLRQPIPRGWAAWRPILLLGLCQNTLYLGLFFTAMTRIPAGLAAIVASAMPLIVAALAPAVVGERIGPVKLAGLLAGFAGVVFIMAERIAGGVDLVGVGIALAGTLALGIATLTVKRGGFGTGLMMVVACQMLVGGIGCVPIALALEDPTAFHVTVPLVFAFLYQVVFPGVIATTIWFMLVRRVSAAGASAFHFLNPIFGVAIAWLMLGEPVSPRDSVGVAMVAAGILLVNLDRRSLREQPRGSGRLTPRAADVSPRVLR